MKRAILSTILALIVLYGEAYLSYIIGFGFGTKDWWGFPYFIAEIISLGGVFVFCTISWIRFLERI